MYCSKNANKTATVCKQITSCLQTNHGLFLQGFNLRCAWKPGGSSLAPYFEGILDSSSSLAPFQAPASNKSYLLYCKPRNKPIAQSDQPHVLSRFFLQDLLQHLFLPIFASASWLRFFFGGGDNSCFCLSPTVPFAKLPT